MTEITLQFNPEAYRQFLHAMGAGGLLGLLIGAVIGVWCEHGDDIKRWIRKRL